METLRKSPVPGSHTILARRLGRSSGFGLPEDLLEVARGRLRVVLWICAFGSALSFGIRLSRALADDAAFQRERVGLVYAASAFVISIAFLALSRFRSGDPAFALRLGLVFEVILAYTVAVGNTVYEVSRSGTVPLLTWAIPLMIVFPLIVPSPPRVTLCAAIAAGSSSVASVFLVSRLGLLDAGLATYVQAVFSPILATAFAYFGSKVVHGLNVDYARAKRLGNYELVSKLGSGGMGEVWLAQHRLLARPAAVKLIRVGEQELAPEHLIRRFEREAQATALLASPHTIGVYDFGVAEDGSFFYVMELLYGMDLESLVTKFGPLPPERAVHVLTQVCASLAEAHANGLVHRDVKPANIFLCQYGLDADFVKVLDFGLVKTERSFGDLTNNASLTAEHTVAGTPAFMSPEQISSGKVGPASDIYALACVAYWLLTGRYLFDGTTTVAMALGHLGGTPRPVSEVSSSTIPPELDALLLECLAKNPEARPESMQLVAERLRALKFASPWTTMRASGWWLEHAPDVARRTSAALRTMTSSAA